MKPPHVFGVVATQANRAMVIRRGSSKLSRMLTWDLDTDEVTAGQWIKAKVETDGCDFSPDGRLAVAAHG